MENFQENKLFGDVFCRYLKDKFARVYKVSDPKEVRIPNDYPDVDVVLDSDEEDRLYLQLKQSITIEVGLQSISCIRLSKNKKSLQRGIDKVYQKLLPNHRRCSTSQAFGRAGGVVDSGWW